MTRAAVLLLFGALLAAASPGISDDADAASWRAKRAARAVAIYDAPRSRPLYWVYRSPRFIPPPPEPELFTFEFVPTNRVNTHMY